MFDAVMVRLAQHTQIASSPHRAALGDGLNVMHLEAHVAGVVGELAGLVSRPHDRPSFFCQGSLVPLALTARAHGILYDGIFDEPCVIDEDQYAEVLAEFPNARRALGVTT